MKKDPVCNMEVDENKAVSAECDGINYFFCSEGCRAKFLNEKTCKVPRTSYDLIIIDGGPAGLAAAVYAATLKMNAFLIAKDLGGQAVDSTKIENYMGYDFITGPELTEKFQYQLIHSHYIDHYTACISHLTDLNDRGEIIIDHDCSTSCPGIFAAGDVTNAFGKRIIIASGEGAKAALAARQYILKLKEKSHS